MFYCSICWKLLYLKINKLLISFLEFFNDLILTNFIANLFFFLVIYDTLFFGVFFFYTFISLVWKQMIGIGIKLSILFAQFYTEMLLLIIHRQCDCGYCITCTKYMYISQNWLFINDKFTSSNMYILSSWSTVFTP